MAFASPLALFLVYVSQLHAASPYWPANRRSCAITSTARMIHEKRAKKTSYASCLCTHRVLHIFFNVVFFVHLVTQESQLCSCLRKCKWNANGYHNDVHCTYCKYRTKRRISGIESPLHSCWDKITLKNRRGGFPWRERGEFRNPWNPPLATPLFLVLFHTKMLWAGLLIFRPVADPRNSSISAKYREIRQKYFQIHVGKTYLILIY